MMSPAPAHPDHGIPPGESPSAALQTGNGRFRYEVVPGWGKLPEGVPLGPTHGTVLCGPDDRVYLCTDSAASIIVWESDGTFVKTIAPQCRGFHAMLIREEKGATFLYGAQNNENGKEERASKGLEPSPARIVKIDLEGKTILEIPNAKTTEIEGGWKGLTAVAVAPDDSIFAACGYGSQKIHHFSPDGTLLKTFGDKGKGDGQTNTCHGLAIDARGEKPLLLVADRENRRLIHFDFDGNFVGVHAQGLRRPCSMAFLGDHLTVAELESRVVILDPGGFPAAFLGDNPNPKHWANFKVPPAEWTPGIFTAPHGLGFDSKGNLYVQDWNQTGRVTKLKPIH